MNKSKFLKSRERMFHESKACGMRPDPRGHHFPMVPWFGGGVTYNVGRNAAKRAKRDGRIA